MIFINRINETRSEYVGMVSSTSTVVSQWNLGQEICHSQPSSAETLVKVTYDSAELGDIFVLVELT